MHEAEKQAAQKAAMATEAEDLLQKLIIESLGLAAGGREVTAVQPSLATTKPNLPTVRHNRWTDPGMLTEAKLEEKFQRLRDDRIEEERTKSRALANHAAAPSSATNKVEPMLVRLAMAMSACVARCCAGPPSAA